MVIVIRYRFGAVHVVDLTQYRGKTITQAGNMALSVELLLADLRWAGMFCYEKSILDN